MKTISKAASDHIRPEWDKMQEFLSSKYYIQLHSGDKKYFKELPNNTYSALGVNGSVKGQLYLSMWDNGTCLTPIYNMTDEIVIKADTSGLTLIKGEWINQ